MPRPLSTLAYTLLLLIQEKPGISFHEIVPSHVQAKTPKQVYDTLYRLVQQELLRQTHRRYTLSPEGEEVIHKKHPSKDGIWKLIIFDIPESQRKVRNFLRQKLQTLGFKKWQHSIWATPFVLDPDLEQELETLARQYFVRLIKTSDINYTDDLEKLFPEN
jgi:DNA-binding transcriptional regulator PaaX